MNSAQPLHAFLRSRRSNRAMRSDDVPQECIERVLLSAAHAPSAHNRQPSRFCVLRDSSAKLHLADEMAAEFRRDLLADGLPPSEVDARVELSRSRILASPVVIVLCMDTSEMDSYPDERRAQAEHIMAIQSTAAAGLQLLLAAHAEGLSGVWTCGPLFAPAAVARALRLASSWEPQAMFFIGYPARPPRPKSIRPLDEVMRVY